MYLPAAYQAKNLLILRLLRTLLEPLIKIAWELEHFPDEWKNGYIIKLPKRVT
jgi:hypothetical protein